MTVKLDGVFVMIDASVGSAVSKSGKPLHGFQDIFETEKTVRGMFEVFRKDWETSVSLVRTKDGGDAVQLGDLYAIQPAEKHLVIIDEVTDPTEAHIYEMLKLQLSLGNEGLVLESLDGKKDYKVKNEITVDVRITGITEGTGKNVGKLGAFITDHGKVGIGFSAERREEMFDESLIGDIIEVKIMEWTKGNKMRHARFVRERFDKFEENLER